MKRWKEIKEDTFIDKTGRFTITKEKDFVLVDKVTGYSYTFDTLSKAMVKAYKLTQ